MDLALMVTFAGILVAGLAGVLGVWMERDREAPPRWAYVFSALIGVAMVVEFGHAVVQAAEDGETEEAMARVLDQLTELADKGGNPALEQFVGAELAAQARSNPKMMKRLEKKMAAKGKDPAKLKQRAAEGRRKAAGLPAGQRKGGAKQGAARQEGERARPEGERPEGERARPEGERVRPEGEGERVRPEGERVRPEGERTRPEGEGTEAPRPKGEKAKAR